MEEFKRIQEELAGVTDDLPTPTDAVSYSVAQFMNFLREVGYEVPVSTTQDIVKTIDMVAKDDLIHVKLLNENWIKNILKSYLVKDPDQDRSFDKYFQQALETGVPEKVMADEQKFHSIAMKYLGDEIPTFRGMADFTNKFVTKKGGKTGFSVLNVIDEMVNFLGKNGYPAKKNTEIKKRTPELIKDKPINAIMKDLIRDEMVHQIEVYKDNITVSIDETDDEKRAKRRAGFDDDAFNEEWMRLVISNVYGERDSPKFDAVLDKFFMVNRQGTIESELTIKQREEEVINPNVLLGAINDYLIEIHGTSVPRVYDSPFKNAKLTEEINNHAAADAVAVVTGARSIKKIRKVTIPEHYKNLVERTLYLRALKRHINSGLANIAELTVDMDEYELERIVLGFEELVERTESSAEEILDDEIADDVDASDLYEFFDVESPGEEYGHGISTIYEATTDEERIVSNLALFIEFAIKSKDITWTFKTGEDAGKTKKVETAKDYLRYRKEQRENMKEAGEKIDTTLRDAMTDLVSGKRHVMSRKEMRDLKDLAGKIPDKNTRNAFKDLLGKNIGKYDRDVVDKINDLIGNIQDKKSKKSLEDMVGDVTLSGDQVKRVKDLIDKFGNDVLKKKFNDIVNKNASFSAEEMEAMNDLISDIENRRQKNDFNDLFDDAVLSRRTMDKILEKTSDIKQASARKKIENILDKNKFSRKELENIKNLIDQSGDPAVKKAFENAMDNITFPKSTVEKLKKMASDMGKAVRDKIDDIFGDGKMHINKVDAIKGLLDRVKDDAVRKKMEKTIDDMPFSSKGMNGLSRDLDALKGKDKNALKRLLKKNVSTGDVKEFKDALEKVESLGYDDLAKDLEGALDKLKFDSDGFDAIDDFMDKIENKYDVKDAINRIMESKDVKISKKDAKDIDGIIDQLMKKREKEIFDDIIDDSRFAGSTVDRVKDKIDDLVGEDRVKKKLADIFDTITGREFAGDTVKKMEDIAKGLDQDFQDDFKDILDRALENGEDANQMDFADAIRQRIDDLEASFEKHGDALKKNDYGAWKWSKDSIDFLKRKLEAIEQGADPMEMFEDTENNVNLNTTVKRLAKTEDAEQMALEWMDAFHKMFNDFADKASDEEKKALFTSISGNLKDGRDKMQKFISDVDVDDKLKQDLDKANTHARDIKEKFNDTLAKVIKEFVDRGLNFVDVAKDMFTENIKKADEGSFLMPPPRSDHLVYPRHAWRNVGSSKDSCTVMFASKKKRRFLTPRTEDIDIFQDVGDEKSPWTFLKFYVKEASDEFIGRTEMFGNFTKQDAIEKLTGQDPDIPAGGGSGGFNPGDDQDPLGNNNPFMNVVEALQGLTEEDVGRDFFRNLAGELFNQLNTESADELMDGGGPIPNPKEKLDFEGNIDIPKARNPFEKSDGPSMTVESKDPMFQQGKAKQRAGKEKGGALPVGGQPQPVPAGAEKTGVEPGYKIGGVDDYVTQDPIIDFNDITRETINKILDSERELEGAKFDGVAMDPMEIFREGTEWDNKTIKKLLEQMVETPANASIMKRQFRNMFRSDVSRIREMKEGEIKVSTIDRTKLVRMNMRNGKNPKNGKLVVTKYPRKKVKSVKKDVFVVDVSGSMFSYFAPVSQLIASLTDPRYTEIIIFDTDAITIDNTVFQRNPASVFIDPITFAEETARKKNRDWNGRGATSYDSAMHELDENKPDKAKRIIFIGDLEHNTRLHGDVLDGMMKAGHCTDDVSCIAEWASTICKKADSCMFINPKTRVGNDITCDLIERDLPVCFTGAVSGDDKKNTVTGNGLLRTMDCLRAGMTGQRPKISKNVMDFCKGGGRETVNPF